VRIIYLARHGETDWNRQNRWQGHTDVPLNAAGRAQAVALATRVRGLGVARVHASDLHRARETAEIVARFLALPPVVVDARLRERSFGVFEGLTRAECEVRHPEAWERYRLDVRNKPPGAEAHDEVLARMRAGVAAIALSAPAGAGAALVVSHGGAVRALVSEVSGVACPPVANGGMFKLTLRLTRETQGAPQAIFHAAEPLP
jgi:broad specificity phosphatase PhoE